MAEKKEKKAEKAPSKKKIGKGDSYVCEVCGLAVLVDEVCGCVDACDIVCCSKPMKERKIKVRATKK